MHRAIVGSLSLLIVALSVAALTARRVHRRAHPSAPPRSAMRVRVAVRGLLALDALLAVSALTLALFLWLGAPLPAWAAPAAQGGLGQSTAIGAALATGLAAIGAGIAVGIAGAAAIGAITEKPETLGRTLIFVGLAEGIAIYGLIISFMLLAR